MRVSKILLVPIMCFLFITYLPSVAFAASFTTKNYSFIVIENSFGVPFTVTGTEWLNINGYTTTQNLVVNDFAISGVIRNYRGYPFDMAQAFTAGKLYESSLSGSGILRGTVRAADVTRFNFYYNSADKPWATYGETSTISILLNKTVLCWATINSWWHSSGTFPSNIYPSINHTFWNGSAGWVN